MGDSVSLVRAVRDQTPILVSSNIRARVLASSFPGENMLQSSSHKKGNCFLIVSSTLKLHLRCSCLNKIILDLFALDWFPFIILLL